MNNMFSKESQTELKNLYRQEMEKVWIKSPDMVDYCTKSNKFFIKIRDKIIGFEKHRVNSEFWFGYSDCGQGLSYDENNARVNKTREFLYEYFMNNNLGPLNNLVAQLSEYIDGNNYSVYDFYLCPIYNEALGVASISRKAMNDYGVNPVNKLTKEEAQIYLEGALKMIEIVSKQCETYWKRFSKNVSVHTYWVDR